MNPCCGCMSLRTGALVIGILEIVLYGLGVFMYGLTLGKLTYAHTENSTALHDALQKAQAEGNDSALHIDVNGLFIILTLMLILSFVQLAVGIVLVWGVKKSSLLLLKSWMAVKVLVIMLSLILLIFSLCSSYFADRASENFIDTITILIGIYFLSVVYSLAAELKKGGTGSGPGTFKF